MADWRRNGWEPAIYFQYLWDVFASPWYLFVSILLISAQPAENDDQTVSRLYRGHDVPGQGLASALHSGGGPSASKLQRREGPRLVSVPHVHTFTRAIRSGCNIVYPSIYLSVYPYIRISIYPSLKISSSDCRLHTPRPRRSPTFLNHSRRVRRARDTSSEAAHRSESAANADAS